MAATHTPAEPAASPIRLLPLLAAIAIMLGFVSGVGFRPRFALWRAGFSGLACFIGIALAALRLLLIH